MVNFEAIYLASYLFELLLKIIYILFIGCYFWLSSWSAYQRNLFFETFFSGAAIKTDWTPLFPSNKIRFYWWLTLWFKVILLKLSSPFLSYYDDFSLDFETIFFSFFHDLLFVVLSPLRFLGRNYTPKKLSIRMPT